MNKATVRLTFTMQYGCELSQAESKPSVLCYFSDHIANKPVDVAVEEDNAARQITVTIEGSIDPRKPLPVDAELVFRATCWTPNDFGIECRVEAGMGTIPLNEIVVAAASTGRYSRDIPLVEKCVGGREKGRVRIISVKKQVDIDARIRWEAPGIGSPLCRIGNKTAAVLPIEREMVNYISAVMQTEMSFPNTYKETANVRIPIYYGNVGLMRPETPLPAAAYFLCKTPDSNLKFWDNSLKIALARDGLVLHDFDRMPLLQQARIMADVVCLVVQGMDYKADTDDSNQRFIKPLPGFIGSPIDRPYDPTRVVGCERFGDALRDGFGDCEDFCLAIGGQIFNALKRADFKGHPQLLRVQEIAAQYVAWMTLDSVTAAAVRAESQQRKLGAHLKCTFLPATYVQQCIGQGMTNMHTETMTKGKPAFMAEVIGNAIEGAKSVVFAPFAPWCKELPVLVGEGTGMFQTYGVDEDVIAEERADVYSMPSLGFAKKTIVHKPLARSSFFVGSMVGFTNYWFEMGLNIGGAWIGYTDKATGQFHRGVSFEDLINKSEKICILPHPPFSDACMDWMRRATSIRVPPRDLILTDEGIKAQPEREPTIDALVSFTESLGREARGGRQQPPAPVYFKTNQLTVGNVAAIKNDIRRNSAVTRLTYTCEHLTDWMHMYRVGFHEQ